MPECGSISSVEYARISSLLLESKVKQRFWKECSGHRMKIELFVTRVKSCTIFICSVVIVVTGMSQYNSAYCIK